MFSENFKKERTIAWIMTIVSLPLSIVGAASNSILIGAFFGFTLALGVDYLVDIHKKIKIHE